MTRCRRRGRLASMTRAHEFQFNEPWSAARASNGRQFGLFSTKRVSLTDRAVRRIRQHSPFCVMYSTELRRNMGNSYICLELSTQTNKYLPEVTIKNNQPFYLQTRETCTIDQKKNTPLFQNKKKGEKILDTG